MKHPIFACAGLMFAACLLASCKEEVEDPSWNIGEVGDIEYPEDYYAGGRLGTTTNNSSTAYKQPTLAVENAGMVSAFNEGEYLFEKDFNTNSSGAFRGLGPVYVRPGCLYCHPGYGHGARQNTYSANLHRNGYLLVIYDRKTDAYVRSVAGMPQTGAVKPFKAPIDEKQIQIAWKDYTDEWGNRFDDGETYSLTYPEVSIPASAYYAPVYVQRDGKDVEITAADYADNIDIRLESTIGIYGTGLLDAIPDDSITAQWMKESPYVTLNPALWDQATNRWKSYYSNSKQGDGTKYVRRYTYALSRGPILDAAGANAIWNITNVTRPDRPYHYLDLAGKYYAERSARDPEVQAGFPDYINGVDPERKHPEWHTADVSANIQAYLTSQKLDAEMTQQQYRNLMIWHRGLAVPAARNTTTEDFQEGKKLFAQIGCATCHRPSWTTGEDEIHDPNLLFGNADMPRYPHQKIWPYTDMVQHRLFMKNDLRTGWCRTTPLWGRGLASKCGSGTERLHDCRARNVIEAIMWHGCTSEGGKSDAYDAVCKFRQLDQKQRSQLVYFVESI